MSNNRYDPSNHHLWVMSRNEERLSDNLSAEERKKIEGDDEKLINFVFRLLIAIFWSEFIFKWINHWLNWAPDSFLFVWAPFIGMPIYYLVSWKWKFSELFFWLAAFIQFFMWTIK